jgi:hypothetical protein
VRVQEGSSLVLEREEDSLEMGYFRRKGGAAPNEAERNGSGIIASHPSFIRYIPKASTPFSYSGSTYRERERAKGSDVH